MEDPVPASLDERIWSEVPEDRAIAVAAGFATLASRKRLPKIVQGGRGLIYKGQNRRLKRWMIVVRYTLRS